MPAGSRYEVLLDDGRVGLLDYSVDGETVTALHTEVDPGHEGEGLGGALARRLLDDARDSGRRVRPVCPFVAGYLEKHPEYEDLVVGRKGS